MSIRCLAAALFLPVLPLSAQLVWTKADEGRSGHAMAVFPGNDRIVLFGGGGTSGTLPDTWEWRGTSWLAHGPAQLPAPRTGHAMATDRMRGRLVLFGGVGAGALLGDTWEWDGSAWTARSPAAAPPPRADHALAYDEARGRVVMFGGRDQGGFLQDLWEWDGQAWALRATGGPAARGGHGLAFDAARGVTVLFGGRNESGLLADDTWLWTGASWLAQRIVSPPPRHEHALACDTARQRVVLFGGQGNTGLVADTWEYDGTAWTRSSASGGPTARAEHALAFDAPGARVVLHGGLGANGYFADTWTWDGTRWSEPSPVARPAARWGSGVAFDEVRGRVVLFGGGDATTSYGDTWEWDGVRWEARPATLAPPSGGWPMAYDALRRRTVLVAFQPTETWEWDGSTWTRRSPATAPPGASSMAFDRVRGVVVMPGTTSTWEWDGIDWRQRPTANAPGSPPVFDGNRGRVVGFSWEGVDPQTAVMREWDGNNWLGVSSANAPMRSPNTAYGQFFNILGMTYDSVRGRTVVVLGDYYTSQPRRPWEHWEWDGTAWQQRQVSTSPRPLTGSAVVFDAQRGRTLVFGGAYYIQQPYPVAVAVQDTWQCFTLSPASFTPYGAGCPGQNGTPLLTSSGRPWTGSTLTTRLSAARPLTPAVLLLGYNRVAFAGGPLPFHLAPLGAPLCDLLVPPDLVFAAGTTLGGTASFGVPIPDDPLWVGLQFFEQFAVLDPAANALGLSFSNAGAAAVGGR